MNTEKTIEIFNFAETRDLDGWAVVDDVVMGGRSDGSFQINEDGIAIFSGIVSLENNGGFSSVRYLFPTKRVEGMTTCKIKLKGDGKDYQFRVKSEAYDRHSYIYKFETTGDWQIIEVPLAEMYPTFRGRTLDMPNYDVKQMEEIRFLIANKKAEEFELQLEWMRLE